MATPENKLAFDGGWEYSPAPRAPTTSSWIKRYELFIGGKFVKPESGKYFETVNPATRRTTVRGSRSRTTPTSTKPSRPRARRTVQSGPA